MRGLRREAAGRDSSMDIRELSLFIPESFLV